MSSQPRSADRAGRTLADRLRSWPRERVVDLLLEREDLATPVPVDSSQLASRAATRTSLLRALGLLTRAELLVLDALAVLGQTSEAELVASINADPAATRAATHRLETLALVWESPEGLRPLAAVSELMLSGAAGQGSGLLPRGRDPRPPDEVDQLLEALSPPARALLDHVDAHGGRGTTSEARRPGADTPVGELLAAGLLRPADPDGAAGSWGNVELPGDVGLRLRGGRTTREPIDEQPRLALAPREERLVDRTAAGAAAETVRLTEQLLEAWATDPPGVLRSGGLGVRDLRATARALGVDEPTTALLVETAAAAGLLAQGADRDGEPAWLPTPTYDAWRSEAVAPRWAALAQAWLGSSRVPAFVGSRDAAGKPWNALVPELSSSLAVETRSAALSELADAGAGATLAAPDSMVERLRWLRPRRPRLADDLAAWTLREAAVLGVTGLGGVSGHGRALLAARVDGTVDGAVDPAAALAPLLPEPVTQVLLQADLTAVAPGPLSPEVARDLALVADVESGGGATVYRFTPGSVRRALDAGWGRGEVHDLIARVAATPVPQALSYLVDDVARTHGRVRAGAASSFVRGDDEAVLAELLHAAPDLGLRRIAPTVLVSDLEVDELVLGLRAAGAAPVVEAADGTVHVTRDTGLRARPQRPRRTTGSAAPSARQRWTAAAEAIAAGDRAADARPATVEPLTPSGSLAALRDALEAGASVTISYVDSHGASGSRHVRPLRVEGGTLTALDHRYGEPRTFAVHRITTVAAGPPSDVGARS